MTRRGLVLGGGGVLGAAWMLGALQALEQQTGIDSREYDAYVGTSAGSVLAALLGCGVGVQELVGHQLGRPITTGPLTGYDFDYAAAADGTATDAAGHAGHAGPDNPVNPADPADAAAEHATDRAAGEAAEHHDEGLARYIKLGRAGRVGLGSRELLLRNARNLGKLPPTAVLAALMPEGRGVLSTVGSLISHVAPSGWAPRAGVTIVALDYDEGTRVAFGADGVPETDLALAVMASCAIPGWYQPVRIGEHRYVDGGAWSSTNLDLLAGQGLDEVYCLAPQVSFDMDDPRDWTIRLERQWRTRVTRRALRELEEVNLAGADVTLLGPGRQDLEAMGGNLMDVSRRPLVIDTSLRTSAASLADPTPLPSAVRDHLGDRDLDAGHDLDVG